MKYFNLKLSRNRKEVGKIPQCETGVQGGIQQDFIPWEGKIDFDFKLPEPFLETKAKAVSLLNLAFIHPYRFLVIEDKLLELLKIFNIGNYQDWKIKV